MDATQQTTTTTTSTSSGGSWIWTIIIFIIIVLIVGIIAFVLISYSGAIWNLINSLNGKTLTADELNTIKTNANYIYYAGIILIVFLFIFFIFYLIYAIAFSSSTPTTTVISKPVDTIPTTTIPIQRTENVKVPVTVSLTQPPTNTGAVSPPMQPVYQPTQIVEPTLQPVYQPVYQPQPSQLLVPTTQSQPIQYYRGPDGRLYNKV